MVIKSFYINIENDLFYGKFDEIYEEWNLFVKASNDISEKGCQFKSRFPIHTIDEALRIMDNYIKEDLKNNNYKQFGKQKRSK